MRTRTSLAIAIAVLLWASSFPVIRSAITADPHYSPGAMALLRFLVASIALALYALATRQFKLPAKNEILPILACGLLGITIYHTLLNYGEQHVSAGVAALLINSSPLWTTLLAIPLLQEKLTPRKTLGISVGFLGVLLITLGSHDSSAHQLELRASLAIVGSAICTSLYVIFQKKFLANHTALQFTSWAIWSGTLLLAPLFSFAATAFPKVHYQHTLEIVYLGIFPAALAYLTFAYATTRLPAARVMSFLYLVPPLAMLIAWPYLHEWPPLLSLLGGALAIAGVAIVNTANKKPQPLIAIDEG